MSQFSNMPTCKRIIVWAAPRCVSNAFLRCMMNLPNLKAFHEPYSIPYYFGSERTSTRYISDPPDPSATYHAVGQQLQEAYKDVEVLFSKDMAYHVKERFEMFLEEGFKNFQHTFLIRNPAKAIKSLYKGSTNPGLTGWSHFVPEEAGFDELCDLHQFVKTHLDPSPVVLDADDLLEFPDEMVKSYCECVGVPYKPGMTKWEPGPVAEWVNWSQGWYEVLFKSSGFQKSSGTTPRNEAKFPDEVHRAIEKSMPAYRMMHDNRLRIPIDVAK